MKKKTLLLTGLLVVIIALVGTSIGLLAGYSSGSQKVTVTPGPGNLLKKSNGEVSDILVESVKLSKAVSERQYVILSPELYVNPGDTILTLTLRIQNMHPEYRIIGINATGYDASGKSVASTIDDPLHSMAWTELGYKESGDITLHLSFSEDTRSIRIVGNVYQYAVP